MKRVILISLLMLLNVIYLKAQGGDQFDKDIRKYLDINGTKEAFPLIIDQMMGQMKSIFPSVPESYWEEVKLEMKTNGLEDLYKEMVPIYRKHFTQEDVKKIIEFYESPTGKKLSLKTPEITQEAMVVGQKWGAAVGNKIVQKLEDKGYKKI